MAVLEGQLASSSLSGEANTRLSLGLHAFHVDFAIHAADKGGGPEGATASDFPVAAAPRSIEGQAARAFGDDWYHRIHVIPLRIALGNVLSEQTESVYLWNAYFSSKTLSSVDGVDAGLTLHSPDELPMTFLPGQISRWDITVAEQGVSQIDLTLTWNFVDAPNVLLPVTGARVVLWPFAPNWKQPVDEIFEWKTRIIKAHPGNEQRAKLRSQARRRLEYEFLVKGDEVQIFDNLRFGWQNRPFGVPYWQYGTRLTAPATTGETTLALSTVDRGFIGGQLAVLFDTPESYEVVEIEEDGVTDEQITLRRALVNSWPAGTKVYPASVSFLEGNLPIRRHTDRALTGRVTFLAEPVVSDPYLPDAAAPDTYNGREILLTRPNWVDGLDNSSEHPYDLVDYGTGRVAHSITQELPGTLRQFRWLFKTKSQAREFREFLRRRAGMFSPVYIPSWHHDLTMDGEIGASSVALTCIERGLLRFVGQHPARRHIMIRTRSGEHFLRPIEAVSEVDGKALLNIGTPLGVSLTAADVKAIHYVELYRFATDRITLQWHTDKVCVVEANFILVEA